MLPYQGRFACPPRPWALCPTNRNIFYQRQFNCNFSNVSLCFIILMLPLLHIIWYVMCFNFCLEYYFFFICHVLACFVEWINQLLFNVRLISVGATISFVFTNKCTRYIFLLFAQDFHCGRNNRLHKIWSIAGN